MDFSQIQSQISSNIDIFMKNYLVRTLKICGNYTGYWHFSKNSNRHKTLIHKCISTKMILF